ncbi:MAG: cation-translocating P-type ATPase [Clostridiales bacterium]|jgi:cation transport ATPase|nr:cation-translocating P-type ATPase [Clostridiales bacterium]
MAAATMPQVHAMLVKLASWPLLRDRERRAALFLGLSAAAVAASFFGAGRLLPADPAWLAVLLCGAPIAKGAIVGLATRFDVKADVLVSIALAASLLTGEIFAAGEIALIMAIGSFLEERTVARARAGIEKLVRLSPQTARVVRGGEELVLPAEQVRVGDTVRVLAGETIAVDGVIARGSTSVDESVITGEPLPVDKGEGDGVRSGSVNQFGTFDAVAQKVGEDSSLQRMIRLVESADAGKAKIVGAADRWATWIVAAALASAGATWLASGEIGRAVTVLVVFCPCALVLATPTAIMAGIGNAARHGILVSQGDALERLAKVRRIAFDKTGTLTYGRPDVARAVSCAAGMDGGRLLEIAASAELRSEHPLGRAIAARYRRERGRLPPEPEAFLLLPGRGVAARLGIRAPGGGDGGAASSGATGDPGSVVGEVGGAGWDAPPGSPESPESAQAGGAMAGDGSGVAWGNSAPGKAAAPLSGYDVFAGNEALMAELGIAMPEQLALSAAGAKEEGSTAIYVMGRDRALGMIALSDTLRPDAARIVREIAAAGVEPVLLTGDAPQAAGHVARAAGIADVRARCLPEDKLAAIRRFQEGGEPVCMVGDGVNDAPALKAAHVGIAMGGIGSDIAIEAADIALVGDDIKEIPHLLRLSRKAMRTININLAASMALNFAAVALAFAGVLNPVLGALVHNAGSVAVIANSALLLNWRGGSGNHNGSGGSGNSGDGGDSGYSGNHSGSSDSGNSWHSRRSRQSQR